MIKINHRIPKHSFITVAVPYDQERHQPIANGTIEDFEFTDDGKTQKAKAFKVVKVPIDNMPAFLTYPAHGLDPSALKTALMARYPQLNENSFITFVLLQKIA